MRQRNCNLISVLLKIIIGIAISAIIIWSVLPILAAWFIVIIFGFAVLTVFFCV